MDDNMISSLYKNIIWDWNGTLLNDSWLCVDIVNKLLVNHNDKKLDLDSYKEVFGFPIRDYYNKIGIDFEKETFDELTTKFMSDYLPNVHKCQLQIGAIDALNEFRKKSIKQFILTAAHKESVIDLLEHYSIKQMFEQIEGLDNHKAESKIDKGFNLLESNSIEINKTVLIGDTIHDYEVANQLGISCILIANGHQSKRRLTEKVNNRVKIFDNIFDLIKMENKNYLQHGVNQTKFVN